MEDYLPDSALQARWQAQLDAHYHVTRPDSISKAEWQATINYIRTMAEKWRNDPPWVPPPDIRTPDREDSPTAYPSPAPSDNDQTDSTSVAHLSQQKSHSESISHSLYRQPDPSQLSIRLQQHEPFTRVKGRQLARSTITTRSKASSYTTYLELDH
ncbi:MAG: hypothetical protein Q9167_004296 [Letrouitia subvulpina]